MKHILIDTNLLLDDPEIPFKLSKEYDKVVITITVLKELDRHKFNPDLAYSARQAINSIREFKNNFPEKLKIIVNEDDISNNDMRIIRAAKDSGSIVATKDISMSIIAESKGVETKLYGNIANGVYNPYIDIYENDLPNFAYLEYYIDKGYTHLFNTLVAEKQEYTMNSWFFILIHHASKSVSTVYAHNPLERIFEKISPTGKYNTIENKQFKIKAKDIYQQCAIYALSKADNVLITGSWGSGKSLLTTAYAVVHNNKKSFISRPPLGIDRAYEIGFLPGDIKDKLSSWAMGFLSATYFLFGNTKAQGKDDKSFDYVKEEIFYKLFELIDINSLQGLSLLDDFLLVDEIQYCTIDLASMLLSRATTKSKLIMTGDLAQSYSLKPSNSGLLKLLRVLPHHSLCYVDLKNTYRSDLIELAEKLQDKSF
jgi:PhoH-like ATPase